MFLLVSVLHVGVHPDEHQHGVSIQISINLGKTFLRISRIRNILLAWILARVFVYLPPFISQIPDFIYWTVLIISYFHLFWMAWHWKPATIWPRLGKQFHLRSRFTCLFARILRQRIRCRNRMAWELIAWVYLPITTCFGSIAFIDLKINRLPPQGFEHDFN